MRLNVNKLVLDLKSFEQWLRATNSKLTNSASLVPARSFVLSTRYLLQNYDKEMSEISGVSSSISQWAFDTSDYNVLDSYGNLGDKLKLTMFSQKNLTALSNALDEIKSNTTVDDEKKAIGIVKVTLCIFFMILMSIQVNRKTLMYYDKSNITRTLQSYHKFLMSLDSKLFEKKYGNPIYDDRYLKSLLVYQKSLRRK